MFKTKLKMSLKVLIFFMKTVKVPKLGRGGGGSERFGPIPKFNNFFYLKASLMTIYELIV